MMKMSDLRHRRMKEVFSFLFFYSLHIVCVCVCVCIVLRLTVRTLGEVTKGGSSCVNPQSRRGVPTPGFVATVSLSTLLYF
jgi:hypothetical protein